MPLMIVFLMVSSTIGFMYGGSEDTREKYNGFTFTKTTQGWLTYIGGQKFIFQYLPNELESIEFNELNYENLYLAYSPGEITNELSYSFNLLYGTFILKDIIPQPACFEELDCPDLPIVSCNEGKNIIGFGNETEGCFMISENYIKNTERIVYDILGVI